MDLEASNNAGPSVRPDYFMLYDAKTDWELDNLLPASWDLLAKKIANDDAAWEKFYK